MTAKKLAGVLQRIGDGLLREAASLTTSAQVEQSLQMRTFQLMQASTLARTGRMILHELNISPANAVEITEIIIKEGEGENADRTNGGDGAGSTDSLPPKPC